MSALARYFRHLGCSIAGYDRVRTKLTIELEVEGMQIHYHESPELLRQLLQGFSKEEILIIYTPALPSDGLEFQFFKSSGYLIKKRAEILGGISHRFNTIAVAGTHGKTTTTTLIAHILKTAEINCFAFLGGISSNYETNLLLGDTKVDEKTFMVVEADEYDRSFLNLKPQIAVVTSVDADHLDIYGDLVAMRESYLAFTRLLSKTGSLIVQKNVNNALGLIADRFTYGVNLDADFSASNIVVRNGEFYFDVGSSFSSLEHVVLGIPGRHNVENAMAAIAVAQLLKIESWKIKKALRTFKGVRRRFDFRIKSECIAFIDDYAHHPEELRAAISTCRELYPSKKITGIFQPHLFSRTRDFSAEFSKSLSLLDECFLLPIYPARELPIENVNSEMLLKNIDCKMKMVINGDQIISFMESHPLEVIITLGAGDIDAIVEPLRVMLKKKYNTDSTN